MRPVLLLAVALPLFAQQADITAVTLAIQNALVAGDSTQAARLLSSSLQRYPHAGELLNLRGVLHAHQGEWADARRDFADATHFAPEITPAWQNLGRLCQQQVHEDSSALECGVHAWRVVEQRKPDDTEAHAALAFLYEEQARFKESIAEDEQLPAAARGQVRSRLIRCADLAALGRASEAQTLASPLGKDPAFRENDFDLVQRAWSVPAAAPVVISLVQSLDDRGAAGIASLRQLAIAFALLARSSDARRTLERVALLDPQNASHLIELARLAEITGDHEGALGYLGHARELEPKNGQVHFLFAKIAMELNLPVEARLSLEKALATDPANPAYNYALGFVLLHTRDAATASDYFRSFVAARPKEPKGHYALGIAYFASGDWVHSKEEMEQVVNAPSTAGGAEYFLGRISRQEENFEDAIRHLQSAVRLLPDYAECHTELARIWMQQGDLERAEQELKLAITIDPKSFPANAQLLALYRRSHDVRGEAQAAVVAKLDEERSHRAELMLRTIDIRP